MKVPGLDTLGVCRGLGDCDPPPPAPGGLGVLCVGLGGAELLRALPCPSQGRVCGGRAVS